MGVANGSKRKTFNFWKVAAISLFLSNAVVLCYSGVSWAPHLPHGAGGLEGLAAVVSLASPAAQAELRPNNQSYVAMCLRVKSDASVREWVLYHHLIGVGKFYVFDDGSDPPLARAIQDLIDAGLVEYNYVLLPLEGPGDTKQDVAYNTCLQRYGSRHTYMGFMDVDEYVILRNHTSLVDFLQGYEEFGGVTLYYQTIGPSGRILRPAAGVLASYTWCAERGLAWVKSIVRTDKCQQMSWVHTCFYKEGSYGVDVWKNEYKGEYDPQFDRSRISEEPAVVYHYRVRSLEDFLMKYRLKGGVRTEPLPKETFYDADTNCTMVCTDGLAWAQKLQKAFGPLLQPPSAPEQAFFLR